LRHFLRNLGDLGRGLAQRIFVFFVLGYVKKEARLFEAGALFFPGVDDPFEGRLFLENGLGFFAVVPEIGLGRDLVQFFDTLLLAGDVKAASAKARRALRGGSIVLGFLPTLSFTFCRLATSQLGLPFLGDMPLCPEFRLLDIIPTKNPAHKGRGKSFFPNVS
jgi:hypothetical protein